MMKDDRLNIRVPSWLRSDIEAAASLLSVSASELAVMCLEIVLGQPALRDALARAADERRPRRPRSVGRPCLTVLRPTQPPAASPGA